MKENEQPTTLVVIPYAPGMAQGWELKTAVHGWRKYFQGDAHIVVIGESSGMVRTLLEEKAIDEHIERETPLYTPDRPREIEFSSIIRFIIESFGKDYPGFVKTDDDIYPVNPFTLADVKRPKWVQRDLVGDPTDDNHFQRAMYNTRVLLEKEGLPKANYSSHCPRYYDFKKLAAMMDRFDCDNIPLLHESLYLNLYNKQAKVMVNGNQNMYKHSIYGVFDRDALIEAIKSGVRWVNNTVDTYDIEIIRTIEEYAL